MSKMEKKFTHPSGASSSPCPDLVQIPFNALVLLAETFKLGEQKHGRDNWRHGLANIDYALERINHIIRHAYWLSEQLQGRWPADCDPIDTPARNVGAILWGGAFMAENQAVLTAAAQSPEQAWPSTHAPKNK